MSLTAKAFSVPYSQTGYFSKTVLDYLNKHTFLQDFYQHPFSIQGMEQAIEQRKQFNCNRNILVQQLQQQYKLLPTHAAVEQNIQLLSQPYVFTITTAHQPNIFTGPLYVIYKILHAIKLAETLNLQFSQYQFIPVYYMGSEDADLEELGFINVQGKTYKWNTQQTGAVGRMKIDKASLEVIAALQLQIGIQPYGNEWIQLLQQCYRENVSIQQATLELMNLLFGSKGLIVLIPDNAALKQTFVPVMEKEMKTAFSHQAVNKTIQQLKQHYTIQAEGRTINLFYLLNNKRARIEQISANKWAVPELNIEWNEAEWLTELHTHPERFSPNVILRGLFQETILPNIAFIGGGGELAYWLELKKVFEAAHTPYPVLVLRNSFLLIEPSLAAKIQKLGLHTDDLFQPEQTLIEKIVKENSKHGLSLSAQINELNKLYLQVKNIAAAIDVTLAQHVTALQVKTEQQWKNLEKKMLRAEKRKFEIQTAQIKLIKQQLFPGNNLQERVENIAIWYARYGKEFLEVLYEHSKSMEAEFTVLELEKEAKL